MTSPPQDRLGERLHIAWEPRRIIAAETIRAWLARPDFPEVKVWSDKHGHPVRLERVENDESHQLIEEFMLAANEAVRARAKEARDSDDLPHPREPRSGETGGVSRVRWLSFNYKVGDLTHRAELQRLLACDSWKARRASAQSRLCSKV